MIIQDLIQRLETWAPTRYAEGYDNVGLLVGSAELKITGILIALDSTEEIIDEAIRTGHNVVLAHHPIIFRGLKNLNGNNYVERAIMKAIKNDIAIYALHTNLDNVLTGVNHKIANTLQLIDQKILEPKKIQEPGEQIGAGIVGQLEKPMSSGSFLAYLKQAMSLPIIKHTKLPDKSIVKVAVCGGAGSFLIPSAIQSGCDALITSDLKYHDYFDADGKILLLDIGHFESERFTIELIKNFLDRHCPEIQSTQTKLITNPVQYFI